MENEAKFLFFIETKLVDVILGDFFFALVGNFYFFEFEVLLHAKEKILENSAELQVSGAVYKLFIVEDPNSRGVHGVLDVRVKVGHNIQEVLQRQERLLLGSKVGDPLKHGLLNVEKPVTCKLGSVELQVVLECVFLERIAQIFIKNEKHLVEMVDKLS